MEESKQSDALLVNDNKPSFGDMMDTTVCRMALGLVRLKKVDCQVLLPKFNISESIEIEKGSGFKCRLYAEKLK
jgi:hypothetical protein